MSSEAAGKLDQRVERLRRIDCCAVSDALDKLGLKGAVTGLPQRSGEGRIAGRAITVKLGVGTPKAGPTRHLGTTAIELGGPDTVIVVEQHSGIEAGSWGGLLSLGAKARGIEGVIADGPVRDIDQAMEMDFPIFSRALTSFTARGRIIELDTNVPVQIGTVTVMPGDYVVADRSAVIFVKEADIDRLLEAAEEIFAREEAMAKAIKAGTPISQVMGGAYEFMLEKKS